MAPAHWVMASEVDLLMKQMLEASWGLGHICSTRNCFMPRQHRPCQTGPFCAVPVDGMQVLEVFLRASTGPSWLAPTSSDRSSIKAG